MSDARAARELIARALVDLEALRELVENRRIADEIFGFLAQQAAEKALKAWLALLGKQYPITHNLDQLLRELRGLGIKISAYGELSGLNPYAVQFRYETMDSSEPDLDRKSTLKVIGNLVEKVDALIKDEPERGTALLESPASYRIRKPKSKRKKV